MTRVNLKSYKFKDSSPNSGNVLSANPADPTLVTQFNLLVGEGDLVKLTGQFKILNDDTTFHSITAQIQASTNLGSYLLYEATVEVDGGSSIFVNVEVTDDAEFDEQVKYILTVFVDAPSPVILDDPISFTALKMGEEEMKKGFLQRLFGIKITLKSIIWFLLIGLIVAFILKTLFVVGGIGFLVLSTLGVLLILNLLGFFFFDN